MNVQANRCRYLLDDGRQCPYPPADDSKFCEQHANWLPADLEVFKAVTEHYRQDIREFWSRSNFYLIVQAGLLSVFVSRSPQASNYERAVTLGLGVLGLIVAIAWFFVTRGSTVWIRRWRAQAIQIDEAIDRHRAYAQTEQYAAKSPLMSSSTVTQSLPVFFCLAWVLLILYLLFSS